MHPKYLARWVILLLAAVVCLDAAVLAGPPSPVVEAAKSGDLKALQAAIAQADVNLPEADGTTALHWAVKRGGSRPSTGNAGPCGVRSSWASLSWESWRGGS